jgi:hypothetical protein
MCMHTWPSRCRSCVPASAHPHTPAYVWMYIGSRNLDVIEESGCVRVLGPVDVAHVSQHQRTHIHQRMYGCI